MAEVMRLDRPDPKDSAIEREVKVRIWWSLYLVDMWCISGQGLERHMERTTNKPPLPMDDTTFASVSIADGAQQPPNPGTEPGSSLLTQLITLVPLFVPIHRLNQQLAVGGIAVHAYHSEVLHVAAALQIWLDQLPYEARMDPDNVFRQQKAGRGGSLTAMHLTYHHFAALLYFSFLAKECAPEHQHHASAAYAARCREHASSFSAILQQSRQLKHCEVLYPNLGHMIVVASAVLIHSLLFETEVQAISSARRELNSNFDALIELSDYWPSCTAMVSIPCNAAI
jgi:hypothetical protein